ncbi:MAG: heavy-metal-associated domain-containing protein [Angelakisella sp.]|nr:heavy-metal-associated domain-containing protein [Angelakisella sp.]
MSKASVYFTLKNVEGKHGSKEIKRELDTLPGVISVSVNDSTERVAVDYDTTGAQSDRIRSKLEKLGYEILDSRLENHIM